MWLVSWEKQTKGLIYSNIGTEWAYLIIDLINRTGRRTLIGIIYYHMLLPNRVLPWMRFYRPCPPDVSSPFLHLPSRVSLAQRPSSALLIHVRKSKAGLESITQKILKFPCPYRSPLPFFFFFFPNSSRYPNKVPCCSRNRLASPHSPIWNRIW